MRDGGGVKKQDAEGFALDSKPRQSLGFGLGTPRLLALVLPHSRSVAANI
jgi:hypothetical protein